MTGFRVAGYRGSLQDMLNPGDAFLLGEVPVSLATVGAATMTADQMLAGVIYRSGSTAIFTDTGATSTNIYNSLIGNAGGIDLLPGMGFKLRINNLTAFIQTTTFNVGLGYTGGLGIGGGNSIAIAANSWRDYYLMFNSTQPPMSALISTTNGSNIALFVLPVGQNGLSYGNATSGNINIQPGAKVGATGFATNTIVTGVLTGPGGLIGFTTSANASATAAAVACNFIPDITISSSGSGPN